MPPPASAFRDTPLFSLEHRSELFIRFETFSRVGNPKSMRHLARALPPPVAVAMVVACAMALAAAAQGRARRNHLPTGRSAYLDSAQKERVDWFPWDKEAFRKARERNQPILVDLGATWCPWCKLMERDSYNDPETAAFIDSHFVAVKVDFDADPKLSAEFERAQAFANLPAGLPLTAFVTPDGRLYFGGGYFPKEATAEKPAFRQTLEEASRMFRDRRATIEREGFLMKIGE